MASGEFSSNYSERVLRQADEVLANAVAIVSPEHPEANPLEVFPAPHERRADDPGLQLTNKQEASLRAAATELGFGREADQTLSEHGLRDSYVIIEGGQPHKVVAEAQMVIQDQAAKPRALIFCGSQRLITSEAEINSGKRLNVDSDTEYNMVRRAAESLEGFTLAGRDYVIPYGYNIFSGNRLFHTPGTSQFLRIGSINDAPVVLMRIDREDYIDEEGKVATRLQPGTADVLRIVHDLLAANDDVEPPIALITSATYQPSHAVDVARASLQTGRTMGVATYGIARLAGVKGESTPAPAAPINQLPGELHKLAQHTEQLRRAVQGE